MKIHDGIFPVCYGQFYFLSSKDWYGDMRACFLHQENGLCGTSVDGVVFFITGLHTGNIHLCINYLELEPDLDPTQDEIVEVSFSVPEAGIKLEAWGQEIIKETNLPQGSYRIRYSAKNFGKAEETGQLDEGDIEFYVVEIWPAVYSKDRIIKSTSDNAHYWHKEIKNWQAQP